MNTNYANLTAIVEAGIAALGTKVDTERDLVIGLRAYAMAIDIVEVRSGCSTDTGESDPADVAAMLEKQRAANLWHESNTDNILDRADAFAEGFYENA